MFTFMFVWYCYAGWPHHVYYPIAPLQDVFCSFLQPPLSGCDLKGFCSARRGFSPAQSYATQQRPTLAPRNYPPFLYSQGPFAVQVLLPLKPF